MSRPSERRLLIRDTVAFARRYGVYGTEAASRRLVLDAVDPNALSLADLLPAHARPIDQIESDITELGRRRGCDGRPLIEPWLEVIAHRLGGERRRDGWRACEALRARWSAALAPEALDAPSGRHPGKSDRRPRWLGAALVVGVSVIAATFAWIQSRDEAPSSAAPCAWAHAARDPHIAYVSSRGLIVDMQTLNRRLRGFVVGERTIRGVPLEVIKVTPTRAGGDARVRLLAGVDDELTELVIEAERGHLITRWGGGERAESDALQLRLDGVEPASFRLVGAASQPMEISLAGRCHTAPPWPTIAITEGQIALAH